MTSRMIFFLVIFITCGQKCRQCFETFSKCSFFARRCVRLSCSRQESYFQKLIPYNHIVVQNQEFYLILKTFCHRQPNSRFRSHTGKIRNSLVLEFFFADAFALRFPTCQPITDQQARAIMVPYQRISSGPICIKIGCRFNPLFSINSFQYTVLPR